MSAIGTKKKWSKKSSQDARGRLAKWCDEMDCHGKRINCCMRKTIFRAQTKIEEKLI
jgi:hypothetical protein